MADDEYVGDWAGFEVIDATGKSDMDRDVELATELHHKAMTWADEADAARRTGLDVVYRLKLIHAMCYEMIAAEYVKEYADYQPTRAVLYRSAAWLAFNCGFPAMAAQLATTGLAGASDEMVGELREVFRECEKRIAGGR